MDWNYNAWGNKYPPFDLDDDIPTHIGKALGLPVYYPGIIMEGGSVDFNGSGTLITSTCCLLNPDRNPSLGLDRIEGSCATIMGWSKFCGCRRGSWGRYGRAY